jgi:hypothetical protein
MSTEMLERELKNMKVRLKTLETLVGRKPQSSWKDAFGAMKGDALQREAAALGAEWRTRENKRK